MPLIAYDSNKPFTLGLRIFHLTLTVSYLLEVTEEDFVMVGTQKVNQAVSQTDASSQPDIESALGAAANSATLTDDSLPDSTPMFHNLRELYQVRLYHCLREHVYMILFQSFIF